VNVLPFVPTDLLGETWESSTAQEWLWRCLFLLDSPSHVSSVSVSRSQLQVGDLQTKQISNQMNAVNKELMKHVYLDTVRDWLSYYTRRRP